MNRLSIEDSLMKRDAYISAIEGALGKNAKTELLPTPTSDVPYMYANISEVIKTVAYKPATQVPDRVRAFVNWYQQIYGI